jgi:hypothetical protein
MGGPRFAVAIAFAALTGVACQKTGGYAVTWSFETPGDASAACGAHGVDAIRITGSSTGGDGEDVTAVCAAGGITHGVPIGTWTFMVHQVDVRGREIVVYQLDADGKPVMEGDQLVPVPNPTTAPVDIGEDVTVPLDNVMLAARPACSDGIDNEAEPDGRIDLDDPDCGNNPFGTTEETTSAAK